MSSKAKKWGVVAGMAILAAAVIFAGGIVGGIVTGVIPVQAEDDNPGPWPGHGRGWGDAQEILETVAEVLGLTPEDLTSELQSGKTLGEVAEAEGVDTQAIVDAVYAQVAETLQQAVEDGRLTQEQADQILERLAECDGEQLRCLGLPFGPGLGARSGSRMGGGWWGPWGGLDAAAEVLGMDSDELMAELRDGKTLAEIAEEKGVDFEAVQEAMIAQMEQTLQEAEDEGTLSPECAECARQHLGECEENWPERSDGFFGMPFGMRGGRHGGPWSFGPGEPAPAEE
jgi:predicted DNA-binding protein YlxM (UPF0122 family)